MGSTCRGGDKKIATRRAAGCDSGSNGSSRLQKRRYLPHSATGHHHKNDLAAALLSIEAIMPYFIG
jgi:hypothetical protein